MIVFQSLLCESTHAHEFLVGIVHLTLGEGNGRPGNEQADAVLVGDDLQIGGVNNLHGIGKVRHQIGHIEAVGGDGIGNALDDVGSLNQRLVAVDHDVEVSFNLLCHFPETLGGSFTVGRSHDDRCAEALGGQLDFLVVSCDVDFLKFRHFLAVLPDPVEHGLAANGSQRLHIKPGRTAPCRDHTDDFHFIFLLTY